MNGNWLAQLAPEHAPAPPPWWPPAAGWWIAAAFCVLLVAGFAGWRIYSARAPRFRARRAAFAELKRIRGQLDDRAAAGAIERLLRRYALTLFGTEHVAKLCGKDWLRFVVEHGGEALEGDSGRALLALAFGGAGATPQAGPVPRESWFTAAEAFIRKATFQRSLEDR